MKLGKLVYIEWVDAVSNSAWFTEASVSEWIDAPNWKVCQVGWILAETKHHLVLCGRQEVDIEVMYGQLQKIPKTWILKRKVIKC